ncbi:MAG: glucosamine-6-phosphate deaminase [Spirochaetes bacterium]|nr:glucosamine-6-phosphate deaminase [Spirochaetota bacterium]
MNSAVEIRALEKSGHKLKYSPTEKTGVITVDNFPELGTLTALRFLEWVQKNPGGVVSLPTGKTPEYFIKEVRRLKEGWESSSVKKELENRGIDPSVKPDFKSLCFVQIDEFYPISPLQHNSFYYYVNEFYINGFGLDPGKALLINCSEIGLPEGKQMEDIWPAGKVDLSLRCRAPESKTEILQKETLYKIDQWCVEYENKIRSSGGIGFFLGGIGPDGHIGFNVRGSDFYSTTRLAGTNYETQAAAATDLGGIEVARNRLVITIGLSTITFNPECTAIIIAAGDAKAKVIADAVQNKMNVVYPATVLQKLPNARFFLTRGASGLLIERNVKSFTEKREPKTDEIEKIIIDLSAEKGKPVSQLVPEDYNANSLAKALYRRYPEKIKTFQDRTIQDLKAKIARGTKINSGRVFLHTEPHHDDLMLGYLPFIVRHIRDHSTRHYFTTLTSGFTSVTNKFMLNQLKNLKEYIKKGYFNRLFRTNYFDSDNVEGKNRDVWQYLDGVAADSEDMKHEGELRRLTRNLIHIFNEKELQQLEYRIDELINYFNTQYPGKKDIRHIQLLKGMSREWEADCLWGYFGWHSDSIFHLRLSFYRGDIFTEEPTVEGDVTPVLNLLKKINPDIVTVAFDPEASGPDTHYKVLQAVTEALKLYEKESGRSDIEIIGYRNIWYRFHPSEADIFVPVSLNMFSLQSNAFLNSFITQKTASFPSYLHDGPFSELAQKIQVEQYQTLKTCLGRDFFNNHRVALMRATRGMVFLKKMSLTEFYRYSRELKKGTENR